MRTELRVNVRADDVQLERPGSSMDRSQVFYLELHEVDALIEKLKGVRQKMALNRRVEAQRLLTEAEQLDPSV